MPDLDNSLPPSKTISVRATLPLCKTLDELLDHIIATGKLLATVKRALSQIIRH